MELNNKNFQEKENLINNARKILKSEFIGIDNEIDSLINNIKPWFLFPELQQSPCVINIFGLTGTGKTSVIKRIVELLDIEEDLVYWNFAAINEMQGWEIEDNIEEQLSNENSKRVFVYDEFQYAATIDAHGNEKDNKSCLKPFWELLDSGIIHKRTHINLARDIHNILFNLNRINSKHKIVLENGVWVNAKECLEEFKDHEINRFKQYFNFNVEEKENGKDEKIQPIARYVDDFGYYFIISDRYMYDIMKLQEKIASNNIDKFDFYDMTFDELYYNLSILLENSRKGYDLNFKQSIIFVIANLDEAYEMAFNTDPDMSADQFHNATKKINILDIKKALQQRFRNEQIARLGNIHLIYPSFNSDSFKRIIDLYLNRYKDDVKKLTDVDIEYKQSLKDFIYKESVFPTQGTRPIFSSIHEIVKSKLPNIFQYIRENNLECTKFILSYKNKKTIATIYNGDTIVGKTQFNEVIKLQNLRESTKDDKQALVAVHECGHFIIYSLLNGKTPVSVRTKTVNKDNDGFVQTEINENDSYQSLLNEIDVAVAGYVAEELVFGKDMMTCGASADLRRATTIASSLIRNYGLGMYKTIRTYQTDSNYNPQGLFVIDDGETTKNINECVEGIVGESMNRVRGYLIDDKIKPSFCKAIDYMSNHSTMPQKIMQKIYDNIDKDVRTKCQIVTNYKDKVCKFINE